MLSDLISKDPAQFMVNNKDDLKKTAYMVTRLFTHWRLSTADQLILLGLSQNSLRSLNQYRKGLSAPSKKDTLKRIGYLLSIHKHLRTLYPENIDLCYTWIHKKNMLLNAKIPLRILKADGLQGFHQVENFLEQLIHR